MAYNYTQFVTTLANELVVPVTDANYTTALPFIIDDADLRCYRELNLLNTVVRDSSSALTPGTKTFNLPATIGTFVVTDGLNVITPAGTVNPDNGTRVQLIPSSREMIDALFPSASYSTVPAFFGMVTQNQVVVGPFPDQGYQVEVVGTQRPAPLSSTNTTTLLTTYFPDLYFAAAMVRGAAYLKNFGASADDPKMGSNWDAHFKELMMSATVEEMRKRFSSQGWSSKEPATIATPPRT